MTVDCNCGTQAKTPRRREKILQHSWTPLLVSIKQLFMLRSVKRYTKRCENHHPQCGVCCWPSLLFAGAHEFETQINIEWCRRDWKTFTFTVVKGRRMSLNYIFWSILLSLSPVPSALSQFLFAYAIQPNSKKRFVKEDNKQTLVDSQSSVSVLFCSFLAHHSRYNLEKLI